MRLAAPCLTSWKISCYRQNRTRPCKEKRKDGAPVVSEREENRKVRATRPKSSAGCPTLVALVFGATGWEYNFFAEPPVESRLNHGGRREERGRVSDGKRSPSCRKERDKDGATSIKERSLGKVGPAPIVPALARNARTGRPPSRNGKRTAKPGPPGAPILSLSCASWAS